MKRHYKELYESYYSYFIGKIVCTCENCSAYGDLADQYFPQYTVATAVHWQHIIHYDAFNECD